MVVMASISAIRSLVPTWQTVGPGPSTLYILIRLTRCVTNDTRCCVAFSQAVCLGPTRAPKTMTAATETNKRANGAMSIMPSSELIIYREIGMASAAAQNSLRIPTA